MATAAATRTERKQRILQEWQARRGDHVWVLDVLAVDPAKRGADAKAEMLRRARAIGRGFGHDRLDVIEKLADMGVALRWVSSAHCELRQEAA